ncbi:uncharacterized protein NECHADRAFT_47287 [Fusarium vanettenii 77-13-4]|uniref:Heterokaryon incompatibility domain-containing protein n=1 Tax=Fusarium vanettenii (strain ATCC MYA-4622 / CBS 123669 / FGSC 9596 / NRRL 45880 / 77-13-4) TaxID=660122 RepID=C7Z040_FUSV7|nr:uncharacterized protein NECHADRAFT_47287 [Fusarium vanettenii 77-13-4]EEU42720.1 hypothetical protein NECHADRAFT_47287 [Fusarium vanettenii 77-13-4]
MEGHSGEPSVPPQLDKSPPGHDIFCTPENKIFLSTNPYQALDPTRRDIRLLKVLPDSGSGLVECELLPSAPIAELRGKYLALSYCAGDPRNTEIILICINQADLSERSHQVGFMRDIYQSAQRTLICLSTSNTHGRGMEWLVELFNQGRNLADKGSKIPGMDMSVFCPTDVEFEQGVLAFWEEIIKSSWWSRAWVFQEFMVSANANFLSGHHHISWTKAWVAIRPYIGGERPRDGEVLYVGLCFPPLGCTPGHTEALKLQEKARFMLKTKAEWKGTDSLTSILARSRNSKASDDRDRVYALIGLADPGYGITPDYSADITLCHVLTQTTRNIILFENRLDVLLFLDSSYLVRRPELPSWVVDWTREEPLGHSRTSYLERGTFGSYFRKDGQAIVSFRETIHPETLHKTTVMEVTGIFVKEIQYLDRPYYGLPSTKDALLKERRGSVGPDGRGWTQVSNGYEAWYLFGSPCKFLLQRESYGHRIIRWIDRVSAHTKFQTRDSERRVITIY